MLDQVTGSVLTYNEALNIGRTLAALSWAKEIVIIDSGSTDGTLEIARGAHANVRIVTRAFDSFAAQCNFGLKRDRDRMGVVDGRRLRAYAGIGRGTSRSRSAVGCRRLFRGVPLLYFWSSAAEHGLSTPNRSLSASPGSLSR